MSELPLEGLRVLEFSHAVLGPTCGMVLADFGAAVIKIEKTPHGDDTRRLKGFGMGYFPYFTRNKQSLAVDIKSDAGKKIIHQLLAETDVLIENFGPGTMGRLGFGFDDLKAKYPRLIYCELKGFMPGPYENRMALDEVVQMMSGLAYMTGPPGEPLRAGASVIDMTTGVFGAMAILLALKERDETGVGQMVRSALFETAAFLMGHHMAYSAISGEEVPPMPARVSAWAIYHQFEVADGTRIFIGVTSDKQWVRFCEEFERADLLNDQRLQTNNDRITEREWLLGDLRSMLKRFSLHDAVVRCEAANLPFSPIARPEDLFDDIQLNQGGALMDAYLPGDIKTKLPKMPMQFENFELSTRMHPPEIGEHANVLLSELGYSENEINELLQSGVIVVEDK